MDSVTTGLAILGGRTTRVVTTNSGLVFLEDLSGSGPTGPPGPEGPAGTVDTSQFYTKAQADVLLAFKQHLVVSTAGSGTEVWDSIGQMVRRLVAGSGITLSLDANGNIVVNATGSSSGIPSTIAEFSSSAILLKTPVTASMSLTANTMIANESQCDIVRGNFFLTAGNSAASLLGTTEVSVSCASDQLGLTALRIRNRTNQQGIVVETGTSASELVLINNSGA